MDLITFGFAALVLAVAGLLASVVIGVRDAVERSQERRYLERMARFSGKSAVVGRRTAQP